MNLDQPTNENLKYILDELKDHLGVANRALLDEEDYDIEKYDDLKFLYNHVKKTGTLSPQETHAFIDELSTIRKK